MFNKWNDKSVTKCKDPKRQTDKASCNLTPNKQTWVETWGEGTKCIKWVFKFPLLFQREEEHLAH